jgi:DNA-binding MarR family transcriptional regulator
MPAQMRLAAIPGYLLRRSQALHNALWARLVPGDLTGPQYAVLSVLATFPHSDQKQVARLASLDKASTTDVVTRLVRKAWIKREQDHGDSRRRLLSLTRAASIALSSITPHVSAVQEALLAPLPATRRASFVTDLASIAGLTPSELHVGYQDTAPVLELGAPGHLLRCAQQMHTAHWAEIMDGLMTGPQYVVLYVVERRPGINQRTLGELAALDSSTTTDIVNRLAARGYVTRSKDPADGRGRILTLTRDAVTQLADVHPKVELVQQRLLDPLRPVEREGFLRDLAHVAFESNPPGGPRFVQADTPSTTSRVTTPSACPW